MISRAVKAYFKSFTLEPKDVRQIARFLASRAASSGQPPWEQPDRLRRAQTPVAQERVHGLVVSGNRTISIVKYREGECFHIGPLNPGQVSLPCAIATRSLMAELSCGMRSLADLTPHSL